MKDKLNRDMVRRMLSIYGEACVMMELNAKLYESGKEVKYKNIVHYYDGQRSLLSWILSDMGYETKINKFNTEYHVKESLNICGYNFN